MSLQYPGKPLAKLEVLDGMFDISTIKKTDIRRLQKMLVVGIEDLKKLYARYPEYIQLYKELKDDDDGSNNKGSKTS